MTVEDLQQLLFQHQDPAYGDFYARLIPTVPREKIIGVRSPEYKKIIRQIKDDPVIPLFLTSLPHGWHEENCLHAALINQMGEYEACASALEQFMPYIDNWAVNDAVNPVCFRKQFIISNSFYDCLLIRFHHCKIEFTYNIDPEILPSLHPLEYRMKFYQLFKCIFVPEPVYHFTFTGKQSFRRRITHPVCSSYR